MLRGFQFLKFTETLKIYKFVFLRKLTKMFLLGQGKRGKKCFSSYLALRQVIKKTFQIEILELGSCNNLAQYDKCPVFFIYLKSLRPNVHPL